jgi:hypothetical protein
MSHISGNVLDDMNFHITLIMIICELTSYAQSALISGHVARKEHNSVNIFTCFYTSLNLKFKYFANAKLWHLSRASISGNTARELLENCASNLAEASRLLLNEENAQSGGHWSVKLCFFPPNYAEAKYSSTCIVLQIEINRLMLNHGAFAICRTMCTSLHSIFLV